MKFLPPERQHRSYHHHQSQQWSERLEGNDQPEQEFIANRGQRMNLESESDVHSHTSYRHNQQISQVPYSNYFHPPLNFERKQSFQSEQSIDSYAFGGGGNGSYGGTPSYNRKFSYQESEYISDYSISCQPHFKSSHFSSQLSHQSHHPKGQDSEEHYPYRQGQILGGKYQVNKLLGEGTFGRVVEGEQEQTGRTYAIKIIRPVKRYIESARIEKQIIKQINHQDPKDKGGIVRYVHSFYHKQHYCLVFRPLGLSLYEVLKLNNYRGFSPKLVQSFLKQIFSSIGFLHRIGYTHTDLKPENILLEERELYTIEGFDSTSSQSGSSSKPLVHYLPKQDRVRIIDFGGATKFNEFHSKIICTRQYRPPEVILECCEWNELADVWSIGCIVVELYTGELMFDTHNDFEHLHMMQKNDYQGFSEWMVKKSSKQFQNAFVKGRLSREKTEDEVGNWRRLNNFETVEERLSGEKELIDLVQMCLRIDPNQRINCKQALKHPFFDLEYP